MKIVWDLETSGFVAPACKILEIGCYIIRDGEEPEKRHWVLDNEIEVPERITEITGITQEIIEAEGRDPVECLNEFLPLFKEAEQNITHNGVRFDIPFLSAYANDLLNWTPEQQDNVELLLRSTAYDTAVHFKAEQIGIEKMVAEPFVVFADRVMNMRIKDLKFNLGFCIEHYGLVNDVVQHRAMADVELTYRLYQHIHKPKTSLLDDDPEPLYTPPESKKFTNQTALSQESRDNELNNFDRD